MIIQNQYPPTMAEERQAIWLGMFNPAAPPTDAQRQAAARLVEGLQMFKRIAYWKQLESLILADLPESPQQRLLTRYWTRYQGRPRKPRRNHRRSLHCNITRLITNITK